MLHQILKIGINRRCFGTGQTLNKHQNLVKLTNSIKQTLNSTKGDVKVDTTTFTKMIKDVLNFNSKRNEVQVSKLIDDILSSPNFKINQESLKEIMVLKPPASHIIKIINVYYAKNPEAHIPRSTAMLPVRHLLWDGDIESATKVVELTTGSPQFIAYKRQKQAHTLMKYFAGLGGLVGTVDIGFRSAGLEPMVGVYAMIVTYVLNMTLFATLSFSDKITGQSPLIQFQKGVSQIYRSRHSDELEMLTRVAEVDSKLNGVEGFLSANFVHKLDSKDLEPVEPESEIMMQEYWLSGGDNFEWSEPDQDPADIIWEKRINELSPKTLKSGTKWTETLIEADPETPTITDFQGAAPV
ncbi:putative membrane protein [Wickerhamomyces ciferrii]|uniref:Membrane protein n=1 Tax=Wickerhamomyces ciferrii (strain ATCC 14091 / BCRC 22168 / CBS 111 / JCM 3599 / NBRC 0793 / NRRL Y-1031 F-60-10) TaxID=1206466 RepID=K0KVC7_WICCF|nr:uncharacterized protein BN7_4976 [Wickerhamomyces ciferrii]CCH45394.1 putative membrane protein [Wickerhamomyces ciferrii]